MFSWDSLSFRHHVSHLNLLKQTSAQSSVCVKHWAASLGHFIEIIERHPLCSCTFKSACWDSQTALTEIPNLSFEFSHLSLHLLNATYLEFFCLQKILVLGAWELLHCLLFWRRLSAQPWILGSVSQRAGGSLSWLWEDSASKEFTF